MSTCQAGQKKLQNRPSYVDSGNAIHVAYYDAVNADLKAAKSADAGVSWTIY